jgi:hypothetical protein
MRADLPRQLAKRLELTPLSGQVGVAGCKRVALPQAGEQHRLAGFEALGGETAHQAVEAPRPGV